MKRCIVFLAPMLFLSTFSSLAQQRGLSSEWDTSRSTAQLAEKAAQLKPLLNQLKPEEWLQKGAPDAYIGQYEGARQELDQVMAAAARLEQQPEKLTVALDVLFRLQSLEGRIATLADGVRRYQSTSIGDSMASLVGDNTGNRDNLRNYIADLAAQKEQEYGIMDKEAQRCRGDLNRQPVQPRSVAPAKKK